MPRKSGIICDICGKAGARIDHVTRCYGKGEALLVIKDVPVVRCPHCRESHLTAQTLHEIEHIKLRRQSLAVGHPVPIAGFSLARNAPGREGQTSAERTQISDLPIPTLKDLLIPAGAGCALARPSFAVGPVAEGPKTAILKCSLRDTACNFFPRGGFLISSHVIPSKRQATLKYRTFSSGLSARQDAA